MQIPALLLHNFTLTQTALCLVNDKAAAIKQSAMRLKQNGIKTDSKIIAQPH